MISYNRKINTRELILNITMTGITFNIKACTFKVKDRERVKEIKYLNIKFYKQGIIFL